MESTLRVAFLNVKNELINNAELIIHNTFLCFIKDRFYRNVFKVLNTIFVSFMS